VQLELPGVTTEAGVQITVFTATDDTTVMLPPLDVIDIGPPEIDAPRELVSEIDVPVVTLGESVTFTVAIRPLETTLAFNPSSRHIFDPGPLAQEMDLTAEVAAGPGTTTMDTMSEEEYVSVH